MPGEPELAQSLETIEGFQRRAPCEIKGEDVKKWREGILVLKDNILHVYKNDTAKSPQQSIGLDKCMIMYATEFEGKQNVIQLKTFTGRIFCFSLPIEEVAQDWIRDMKSSDYSALKEKVVSLEEGLRVIGLAQESKAKEDRDKWIIQKKQQAVQTVSYVYGEIQRRREIQILMQWLSLSKQRALEETLSSSNEKVLQEQEEIYQKKLTELQAQLEVSEKKSGEIQECQQSQSRIDKLRYVQKILSAQHERRLLYVFMEWRQKALKTRLLEEKETEVNRLQTHIKSMEEELQSLREGSKEAESSHKEEIERLKTSFANDQRKYEDLQKEHYALKTVVDETVAAKEACDLKNRDLAKQIEQMASSLAVFQEVASSNDEDAQAVVARLQLQVNELQTRLEGTQRSEEESRRKWEELQDFSVNELQRAQKRIDELTATCSQLVTQVEEAHNGEHMTSLLEELEGLKLEKQMLLTQVQEVQSQYEATVDVVNNSSNLAIERENQLDDLRAKIGSLEKELRIMTESKEEKEKELLALRSESEETITRLQESEKTQHTELTKLKRRVLTLKNMEETMKDVEDLLQQREKQLKDVLERIKKAEKTSEECKKEMIRVQKENDSLQHQMENYHFREGQAGEVLEKVVEVLVDKPDTLQKLSEYQDQIRSLEVTIDGLKEQLAAKAAEEERALKVNASFKAAKKLPLKFFPLYPTLRAVEEETECLHGAKIVKIELEKGEKEPVKRYEGRNPDVVKREEEERKRREEEERRKREEEERKRKEEEERKRREEEERKRREEEERKRREREEEERKRREEEERKRKEEEERKQKEEEEKKRQEEEEKRRQEEKKQQMESEKPIESSHNNSAVQSINPFNEEEQSLNPFGELESQSIQRPHSPNPFDEEEDEDHEPANPFDDSVNSEGVGESQMQQLSPNPFDQDGSPRHQSPNPFDQDEPSNPFTEEESTNPFASEDVSIHPQSPNPFDQDDDGSHLQSPNPFDQDNDGSRHQSPNPFDQDDSPRLQSPNPFDQDEPTNPFTEEESTNPFASEPVTTTENPEPELESSVPSINPFAQDEPPYLQSPNPFDQHEPQNTATVDLFAGMDDFTSTNQQSENPVQDSIQETNPIDFTSILDSQPEERKSKKSLWKLSGRKRDEEKSGEEGRKHWGLSDKQKDKLKGGVGRFQSILKTAAAKGQSAFGKRTEEPESFPECDGSDLTQGMHSRLVEYFFKSWQYPEDEKKRVFEWIRSIVEDGTLKDEHLEGLLIERATVFAEEGFRTCLIPLLSQRDSIQVDFTELPTEEGLFTLQIRVAEKTDLMDDLLSGFYLCLLQTYQSFVNRSSIFQPFFMNFGCIVCSLSTSYSSHLHEVLSPSNNEFRSCFLRIKELLLSSSIQGYAWILTR